MTTTPKSSVSGVPAVRLLTEKEAKKQAKLAAKRAEALRRFKARYRHRPESQRAMIGALRRLASAFSGGRCDEESFPWEVLVRRELTQQVWDCVADQYSRRTAIKDASALRVILRFCRDVELITYDQWREATDFEAKGGKRRPPAGHYLDEAKLADLVAACARGSASPNTRIRDVALVLTLASTGARRSELSQCDLSGLHLTESRIWLGYTKNGEPRWGYLHPVATQSLRRWLEVRGLGAGPLFVPLSRTGRPLLDRGGLSSHQMWKVIRQRAEEAGLGVVTPHDMRRFLVSNLLDRVDLTLVAAIAGHKNPATTAGYDKRPALLHARAVATLQLPPLQNVLAEAP